MILKTCERCNKCSCGKGLKYCIACSKIVLKEMKERGFLKSYSSYKSQRTPDAMEDIRETKKGRD